MAPSSSAVARLRLSLRWKAFGMLLLLLAVVHAFFGFFVYRELLSQYRQDEAERLDGLRQSFDGQLAHSAQDLGRIGAQIVASTSQGDLARHGFDSARLSPELLGNLSGMELFDPRGNALAGFQLPGSLPIPAIVRSQSLPRVRQHHRPVSSLVCTEECIQYVAEPAFDQDGHELLVVLGQPLSEVMLAFARQTGTDIALLSGLGAAPGASGAGRLFGRRVYAVTHAPLLLPRLRRAAAGAEQPVPDQPFAGGSESGSFMLQLSTLHAGDGAQLQALFILDEAATLRRIRSSLRQGIAVSLAGLLLSALALWLFLSPLTRRLQSVSHALPLLAARRFADARDMLGKRSASIRLADEIDLVAESTRRLSRQLEKLDATEAASEAKSRFLATVSHEIRTPLNGILGMLEVLQHSHLDPKQRDSIRMVHDSAQSLLGLMDDTLDLARIEAGRIELQAAPFSIEEVVAGCVETAAPRARRKALKLISHVDPALPPMVLGDAMRLRQVLGNLCANAVKFTSTGRVIVRAERSGGEGGRVRVRFSVLDTGIGIAEQAQQYLFEPFQQADASTAARYGGSGLGLSICRGLVQRMGGRIGFVSNPGAGTEFSVWLEFPVAVGSSGKPGPDLGGLDITLHIADPDEQAWLAGYLIAAGARLRRSAPLILRDSGNLGVAIEGGRLATEYLPYPVHRQVLLRAVAAAAGRQPADDATPPVELPQRRLRVLAVDDHPTNRHVIQAQLTLLGHQADTAADGEEALRLLAQDAYDVLLTDLRMPGMDGVQLVREIRRQEAAGLRPGRLPVLAFTAQPVAGEPERCLEAGMDGCLPKPLPLAQLREALARCGNAAAPAAPPREPVSSEAAPIDRAALLQLVGNDDGLATELLAEFVRINSPPMRELVCLGAQRDFEALAELAHRLLGSARTVAAGPLAAALTALEGAARERRGDELAGLVQQVQQSMQRLRSHLDQARTA